MTQAFAIKGRKGEILIHTVAPSIAQAWINFLGRHPTSYVRYEAEGFSCVPVTLVDGSAAPVGEWTACGNILMNADDLYDVKITVDGNWPDDRHRATFMHRVAKLLNAPPADDARRLLERVNAIFVEMRGSIMDRVRLAEDIHNHLARSGK